MSELVLAIIFAAMTPQTHAGNPQGVIERTPVTTTSACKTKLIIVVPKQTETKGGPVTKPKPRTTALALKDKETPACI